MPNQEKAFSFRCISGPCGNYATTKDTFLKFLTPLAKENVEKYLSRPGIHGVLLQFDKGCPKCSPNVTTEAILIGQRMKK